jgi:hypothetical protein
MGASGTYYICYESQPPPIQSGCACRDELSAHRVHGASGDLAGGTPRDQRMEGMPYVQVVFAIIKLPYQTKLWKANRRCVCARAREIFAP